MEENETTKRNMMRLIQSQKYRRFATLAGFGGFVLTACLGMAAFAAIGQVFLATGNIMIGMVGLIAFALPMILGMAVAAYFSLRNRELQELIIAEIGMEGLDTLKKLLTK